MGSPDEKGTGATAGAAGRTGGGFFSAGALAAALSTATRGTGAGAAAGASACGAGTGTLAFFWRLEGRAAVTEGDSFGGMVRGCVLVVFEVCATFC